MYFCRQNNKMFQRIRKGAYDDATQQVKNASRTSHQENKPNSKIKLDRYARMATLKRTKYLTCQIILGLEWNWQKETLTGYWWNSAKEIRILDLKIHMVLLMIMVYYTSFEKLMQLIRGEPTFVWVKRVSYVRTNSSVEDVSTESKYPKMSLKYISWQWLDCSFDLGRTLPSNLVVSQNFKLIDNLQGKIFLHLLQ